MIRRGFIALVGAVALTATVAACGSSGSSGGGTGGSGSGGDAAGSVAATFVFGGPPEFQKRPDGIPGLKETYGITFKSYKSLDSGGPLTVNALKTGTIQAADLFTTDPAIKANNFVVLEDNKTNFAAQNILPLINKSKSGSGVSDVLNAVSAKLDTDTVSGLLEKVNNEKQDSAKVASDWLASSGVEVGKATGSLRVGSANFAESTLLANIYAAALTKAGVTVSKKLNIGSREAYIPGLKDGSIDLIPEYTGVLLQYFNKGATETSADDVYAALQKVVPAPLTVLDKSAAEDKDAVVVSKQTADKYNLKTIEDLANKT